MAIPVCLSRRRGPATVSIEPPISVLFTVVGQTRVGCPHMGVRLAGLRRFAVLASTS